MALFFLFGAILGVAAIVVTLEVLFNLIKLVWLLVRFFFNVFVRLPYQLLRNDMGPDLEGRS